MVNFKGFKTISITVDKYGEGIIWMRAPKKVVGRLGSRLKLRYRENRMDSPVIWYFEPVDKTFYPFFDSKRTHILLG